MIKRLISLVGIWCMAVMLFSAHADYGAAITLHTTIYETYGASNDFTILLGSSESGDDQVIEYDCGTGSQEAILKPAYTTTDEDGNTVTNGTYLSCRVKQRRHRPHLYGRPQLDRLVQR